MLDFVKNFGRKRMIKQLTSEQRSKKIENIEHIKTLGIIFTVADEYDWNVLYHFITTMEKAGKKVNVIGMQASDIELGYIITHPHTLICHEKEDLNFWGVPKEEKIRNFTDTHYDLIIDATEQPDFFGQYITLKCQSDLRVARIDTSSDASVDSGDMYDLMIHSEGTLDMKEYLNNVYQYLSNIQK